MTVTFTDLFCGAGGSSVGATAAGMTLAVAANHWRTAIDVHQTHFPDARHDCADISQADPRRYPRTRVLLASPECTNHSQARGVSRRRQDPSLWDAPDPSAERSRATMWVDVVSSTRRRGGSELDARMVCPTCATVHTVTVFLHVDAEAARRTAAAGSIQGEPGVQFGGRL